ARARERGGRVGAVRAGGGSRDVPATRVQGRGGGHAVREAHRCGPAAKVLSCVLVEAVDVVAFEQDFPGDARAPGWMKAENGTERDALAGAGLAEECQDLPRAQLEAHRAHGAGDALPRHQPATEGSGP